MVKEVKRMQALVVGSDWAAPAYEAMLRSFVKENELESRVHFINKTMDVVPYLAASDILVQNAQVCKSVNPEAFPLRRCVMCM